jgi:hypothetical protein
VLNYHQLSSIVPRIPDIDFINVMVICFIVVVVKQRKNYSWVYEKSKTNRFFISTFTNISSNNQYQNQQQQNN